MIPAAAVDILQTVASTLVLCIVADSCLPRPRWYRRWRGGRWAKVTAPLWRERWIRFGAAAEEMADEVWP